MEVSVGGQGSNSTALAAFAALPGVTGDDRRMSKEEVGVLIAWPDIVVLRCREASQGGVASRGHRRRATSGGDTSGGVVEQLRDQPRGALCGPTGATLTVALDSTTTPAQSAGPAPAGVQDEWRGRARIVLDRVASAGRFRRARLIHGTRTPRLDIHRRFRVST